MQIFNKHDRGDGAKEQTQGCNNNNNKNTQKESHPPVDDIG